jgi:hypothetical protein
MMKWCKEKNTTRLSQYIINHQEGEDDVSIDVWMKKKRDEK